MKYQIFRNRLQYEEAETFEEAQDAMNKVVAFVRYLYTRIYNVSDEDIRVCVTDKSYHIASVDGKHDDFIKISKI